MHKPVYFLIVMMMSSLALAADRKPASYYDFKHPVYSDIWQGGVPVEQADTVIIAFHGKGGGANRLYKMSKAVAGEKTAYLAPSSSKKNWYDTDAMRLVAYDDARLLASLGAAKALIQDLNARGVSSDKIVLLGFSQGAALIAELIAREKMPFKGVMMVAGLLHSAIGTGAQDMAKHYPGDLSQQKIHIAAHDQDPAVPIMFVNQTVDFFRSKGADVRLVMRPGRKHTQVPEDTEALSAMVNAKE